MSAEAVRVHLVAFRACATHLGEQAHAFGPLRVPVLRRSRCRSRSARSPGRRAATEPQVEGRVPQGAPRRSRSWSGARARRTGVLRAVRSVMQTGDRRRSSTSSLLRRVTKLIRCGQPPGAAGAAHRRRDWRSSSAGRIRHRRWRSPASPCGTARGVGGSSWMARGASVVLSLPCRPPCGDCSVLESMEGMAMPWRGNRCRRDARHACNRNSPASANGGRHAARPLQEDEHDPTFNG